MGKHYTKDEIVTIYREYIMNDKSAEEVATMVNRPQDSVRQFASAQGGKKAVMRKMIAGATPESLANEYIASRTANVKKRIQNMRAANPQIEPINQSQLDRIEKKLTLICTELGIDVEKKTEHGFLRRVIG